jgi:hypothetical protein
MLWKLIPAGSIVVVAIVALLTGSNSAQSQMSIPLNPKRPPTQEEIDRQKAADQAYDATMQKIPDKKSYADPWGNIRPSPSAGTKNRQQ